MLAINSEYDHDMCWRSRMIMIMACVGDQINQNRWLIIETSKQMIDYWGVKTDDWLLRHQNRWLIIEALKQMIDYWGIKTDDWLLRHQNRWLITEAPKTDDWLLRWPLLVYGGTEGSKEQIANSNGVDRCFKRMVIWQSFLALFNCWWIHPWSDVDIDARIFFKTLCQKLTCDVQKETS